MPRDVIVPALGMAQDTARIVSWLKRPGEAIRVGDALMEVETDKAVVEVEAQAEGFLTDVSAAAGDNVPVGHVVAVIVDTAEAVDAPAAAGPGSAAPSPAGAEIITGAAAAEAPAADAPTPAPRAGDARRADIVDERSRGPLDAGRILASPRARRLALERGLDLARLVEAGVPQPYHVADLETLERLGRGAAPSATAANVPAADTPLAMQVTARVPASGCDGFIDWMANEEQVELPARSMWLRFATAALRRTGEGDADGLVVEVRRADGEGGRFADADRSRLSQPVGEHDDLTPDLVLRDFTGSPIVSASVSPGSAPVLTIGRERDDFVVAFDYRADRFDEDRAVRFTSDFAERLGEPLLHLL